MVDERFHTVKRVRQFYKNKGSLELIILIRLRSSNIAGLYRISEVHYMLLF